MKIGGIKIVFKPIIFASLPYKHLKIGGQWKHMIDARRRIHEGAEVMVGVAVAGMDETLYFSVERT